MRFKVCGRQSQGGREYQEDAWLVSTPESDPVHNDNTSATLETSAPLLVALSDGIGSGGHGDIAGKLIVTRFQDHMKTAGTVTPESLQDALFRTDEDLRRLKQEKGYGRSMGGTLVAGIFDERTLTFLSVGDSHLFRFRDDEIHYINEKHRHGSEQDELASLGQKSWPDALRQYGRSSITSAVIGSGIETCQIATRDIRPGDVYVFASDGVDTIEGELLRRLVSSFESPNMPEALEAILKAVDETGKIVERGEHDNTTLVMIRCETGSTGLNKPSLGDRSSSEQSEASSNGTHTARAFHRPGFLVLFAVLILALAGLVFWPSAPL